MVSVLVCLSEPPDMETDCMSRPKSENAVWEDAPQDGEPFDYNAVPSTFYIDIESIGNLEPDAVVQQGIKVLQQKIAAVLQELVGGDNLDGADGGAGGDGFGGPQSPGGMGGETQYEPEGYTTPFANPGGATNAWGGGATPYGATPYRSTGWNG